MRDREPTSQTGEFYFGTFGEFSSGIDKWAIESLTATIRSFNKRERGLQSWTISCEKDVRDLLYVMLRPTIFDIAKEEAIPSKAGTHKIADLCSNT